MELDAITFDFWDTLLCAPNVTQSVDLRSSRITRFLVAGGMEVVQDEVWTATKTVWDIYNSHWQNNQVFTATDAAMVLAAELSLDASADLLVELTEAFAGTNATSTVELTPNIAPALRRLKASGLRIGIVCDVGMAPSTVLRGHLERHDIINLFDHWSFSDEVGCYKPDRRIFEHALAGLGGIDPARAVHVGDLRRTDVAGARAMGMTTVRYRGRTDDPASDGLPEAHHILDDHRDLPALLGLPS